LTSGTARAQENVKRVQLAEAYLSGAELAGVGGSSMPEEIKKELKGEMKKVVENVVGA